MKIRFTFKTPGVVDDGVAEAVTELSEKPVELDEEEWEGVVAGRIEKLREKAKAKWFTWGEYVTVEWDTDADTCVVIPKGY